MSGENNTRWSYGLVEAENMQGNCASREEAMQEALKELDLGANGDEEFQIGKINPYHPHISADSVFDQLACDASDHAGEFADGWPAWKTKNDADYDEFEKDLNIALQKYLDKTKQQPEFYQVVDIETVKVKDVPGFFQNSGSIQKEGTTAES